MLITASFAVSRQMLHSKVLVSFSFSSAVESHGFEGPACSPVVLMMDNFLKKWIKHCYLVKDNTRP